MARKVFISFLGFSNYGESSYVYGTYKSKNVRYVQEATLDYLIKKEQWTNEDVSYILLTKGAEAANWVDNGHKDRTTREVIKQTGLESQLQAMNLPLEVKPIKNLPDGNNEEEIWKIFSRVFQEIKEDDELYFDITHGFRYLPMLTIVLGNYLKFLRNVTIKHISYGNYEGRNKVANESPIIDLLPFSSLQDWTYAAAQFLNRGDVSSLVELSKNELKPLLQDAKGKDENLNNFRKFITSLETVIMERNFCRGIEIVESKGLNELQEITSNLKHSVVPQMAPIVEKIKDSFDEFSPTENVMNGFAAAKWCVKNSLYQQAITILQENIITLLCFKENLNWHLEVQREIINIAFFAVCDNKQNNEVIWNLKKMDKAEEEEKENYRKLIRKAIENPILNELAPLHIRIKDIRNDFNHSGMRINKMSAKDMKPS
ncbi:MAG: TIGR02221 family CRISPR-associated protein [bacterium]